MILRPERRADRETGQRGEPGSGSATPPTAAPEIVAALGMDFLMRGGAAYVADPDGRVLWGNAAWHEFAASRVLGVGEETGFIPWTAAELTSTPPADAIGASVGRSDRFLFAGGYETLQSQHWVAWRDDGTVLGLAGLVVGATDEERLRRGHLQLQERYDDLSRLVSDGIWETGPGLELILVSPRIGELGGFHPRELLGRMLTDFGTFVDAAGRPVPSPLDHERPQPFRDRAFILRDAKGASRHFRVAGLPIFDPEGRFQGYRGTARDVTGEALALGLVAQSRSQLTQAIESISEGFALFDAGERLLLWNQRYLSALPRTASAIHVGMRFQELMRLAYTRGDIRAGTQADQLLAMSLTQRARKQQSLEFELGDGRWIRSTDRFTADGSIVGVRTDITESKLRERALIEAKEAAEHANRSKSEFLANVSHELRTPLNAVIGFSELILSEVMGPIGNTHYSAYLQDILSSGRHLLDVINDILDLARAESGALELNVEIVDISEIIESVIRPMRERALRAELRLNSKVEVDLPPLDADPRKLRQILFNLVGNSIKFTMSGGTVTVTAGRGEQGDLVIRVVDTGIGMSAADLEIAFRPFGQVDSSLSRKYQGTGLGLPLTRAMIELHGGSLNIESSPGRGTTAIFRLPAARLRLGR